ncbi:MAG TPA: hypothetical protein VFD02_04580 [Syntrophomonadaceae bacterium]|nr:hypothetical protein [Syntrophomonadaceae bacterium]
MAYVGAVVGAGFASGQEVVQFFVRYGIYGLKGVVLAAILFSLLGGILLYLAHQEKISTYQDLFESIFGHRLAPIIDLSLAIFLFLGISTMLSASGAIFQEHLYLPKSWGVWAAFLLVGIFLVTGKKGLVLSYNILVPIKLVLLLSITLYVAIFMKGNSLVEYTGLISTNELNFWPISSLLYVGYNFALAIVILTEYQSLTSKKGGIVGGVWGGFFLGLLLLSTYLALGKYLPAVLAYEVPMLFIAGNISLSAKQLYTIVLWVGILTTALANTYGFTQRFSHLIRLNYKVSLFLSLILALPLSGFDFSVLVGHVYPVFGALGLVIITFLSSKAIKDIASELYYNIMQYKSVIRRK